MIEDYEVSSDRARMDLDVIWTFLSASYWARGIPREVVQRAIENSLCFGAFNHGSQIGFARVITDYTTFAYLADVFVLPEHRRRGVARMLVAAMLDHPKLAGIRRFLLATRDAHALYAPFGFHPLNRPDDYMTIRRTADYGEGAEIATPDSATSHFPTQ